MIETISQVLEVDPTLATPASGASPTRFKTLTAALQRAQPGTLIRLGRGVYSAQTGERFPLKIPPGVILTGDEAASGTGTILQGGGPYSAGSRQISVGLVVPGEAQIRGVTITNPQGIGLVIPDGHPLIRACQLRDCGQDGLWIMGSAQPAILDCKFDPIAGSGILAGDQAKGEIRGCSIRRSQCGIKIGDQAAPYLDKNQCIGNQIGIWVLGQASPVLRRNQVLQNQTIGLWVQERAHPDIGHPHDEGQNRFRYQQQADIKNDGAEDLVSVGNDVLPQYLSGSIQLLASAVPDQGVIKTLVATAPIAASPGPQPTPGQIPPQIVSVPVAPPTAPPTASPTASQFTDVSGHWAAAYIEALARRDLVKGFEDGRFRPDGEVTRGQFAALVGASFPRQPAVRDAIAFTDVPPSLWAHGVITQVYRQGFMGGYPDQTFRPDQAITRVQGIVAIATGLGFPDGQASQLSIYQDRAQIPSYAVSTVAAATQQRLIINYPDVHQLRPLEVLTRAEAAALVYQGLVALGQAPMLDSDSIVRPDTTQPSFPDIAHHWAEPFILGLVQQNLIRGFNDGRFQPDQAMTRAQYASLVVNAFQPTAKRPSLAFRDVPPNFWAAAAIDAAYRAGFLSGFPDGSFAPDHGLLRVQTWVSLENGLDLAQGASPNRSLLTQYIDQSSIPAYALDGVALATQHGLVVNRPDPQQLNPNRVATRADVCAAVYQALVALQRLPAVESAYIVRP